MGIVKIIAPGSQNFNEAITQQIKMSRQGLMGEDLKSFIKRAGHPFANIVQQMKLDKGEVPIHLIALGTTEAIGPNRNGDGFKEAACRKYHPTFVKHARFFRSHKNKNKAESYGIVKASTFNEPMQRIELIVALNGTKEAAEKNGGLIADKELEKLASGKDIAVSMSCFVNYDECSSCHNKAKNRSEYCHGINENGHCKHGGLKNHIGQVCDDGHHLHADNPHPKFFDISDVYRNADRIAWVFGKAANSGIFKSGAELAEELGITAPWELIEAQLEPHISGQIKCAYLLAEAEKEYEQNNVIGVDNWARAFDRAIQQPIDNLDNIKQADRGKVLNALAKEKIAMPLCDFLRILNRCGQDKAAQLATAVSAYLPGIFSKLAADVELEALIRNNPYRSSTDLPSLATRNWANKLASDYSINKEHVARRILRSTVRNEISPTIKVASVKESNPELEKLARHYSLYKIGFLYDIAKNTDDLMLTTGLLIRQNYIN